MAVCVGVCICIAYALVPSSDPGPRLRVASPKDLAAEFVEAVSKGGLATAEPLFISEREFVSLFSAPNAEQLYGNVALRFTSSLKELDSSMKGARFVRLDMSYAGEPVHLKAGQRHGPFQLKADTVVIDNVHAVVAIGGTERDLKLDEILKVGKSWRLLDAVTLTPRK